MRRSRPGASDAAIFEVFAPEAPSIPSSFISHVLRAQNKPSAVPQETLERWRAHDTGPLIRSKDGFWLAIPTAAAGKGLKGGSITPGEWERRRGLRLRFVYRGRGASLVVADGRLNNRGLGVATRSKTGRGKATVPVFFLVPQVKLAKRLNLARDPDRAQAAVPGLIVANLVSERV